MITDDTERQIIKCQVSYKDRISHPWGVTCRDKFPVATFFVAQGTHDNVASNGLAADFFTEGEFERFCEQKDLYNEQNRLVLVNLTSTGCRHRWGIHKRNKWFQLRQQRRASLCRIPAMRSKSQSSLHNISYWRKRIRAISRPNGHTRHQVAAHLTRSRGCSLKKQKNLAQCL